jgi:GTP-binding protein LepA
VPAPTTRPGGPTRALIFDSVYDAYRGVITTSGSSTASCGPGTDVRLMATGFHNEIDELAVISPEPKPIDALGPGEVGYFTAAIKEVDQARVGDTVTDARRPAPEPLPGYREPTPMVFSGLYPVDSEDFPDLRDALEKLRLNDASFTFEPETSAALGFGFRCGFLGLLHMEIISERLDREYDIPSSPPRRTCATRSTSRNACANPASRRRWSVSNPAELPEPNRIAAIREPVVDGMIITPTEYVGAVMQLCEKRAGTCSRWSTSPRNASRCATGCRSPRSSSTSSTG